MRRRCAWLPASLRTDGPAALATRTDGPAALATRADGPAALALMDLRMDRLHADGCGGGRGVPSPEHICIYMHHFAHTPEESVGGVWIGKFQLAGGSVTGL